jgi:Ca-activated chloride channel family protein
MIREICNILFSKRIASVLTVLVLLAGQTLHAQADRKNVRQGNRKYGKSNFSESEISYRKATDANKSYPDAVFNTGDALYRQNKFEDAGKQFLESANMNEDPVKKSASMFNLGNSLLKANKLEESIEAYKNSLKLNPESPEAKYNLAYAQDMLKKQKEQQQQQQQQNKDNQDQKKDQNKKDQKDQQKDKKDEQKNDKQDQNKQQEQQGVSKDDAERLLNALANEEKNVQEKVKLAKAAKEKVRTVKNW